MKILCRRDFLKTSKGTAFVRYQPGGHLDGPICVKSYTFKEEDEKEEASGFWYQSLLNFRVDAYDVEFFNRIEAGEVFRLNLDDKDRDVEFDPSNWYVVFDREDLKTMIDRLSECYASTSFDPGTLILGSPDDAMKLENKS